MNPRLQGFLQRLANLSSRSLLVAVIMAGGLYYMMYFTNGKTQKAQLVAVQGELQAEQTREKQTDQALKEREQVLSANTDLDSQIKNASQQLPRELSDAAVNREIDSLARTSGLRILSKEPRSVRKDDMVEISPIFVRGEGTFSEITLFFYYIASLKRITRVASFRITPVNRQAGSGSLQFETEILNYRSLPEPPPVAGGAK